MNKILTSVLAILFCGLGCKEPVVVYAGTYPQEKFVAVLTDIYIAQAALKDVNHLKFDSLRNQYRSQIETIHEVDITIIEKDLVTLQEAPALYKQIHSIVADSVVFMEKRINKKEEKKIDKKDYLKKGAK